MGLIDISFIEVQWCAPNLHTLDFKIAHIFLSVESLANKNVGLCDNIKIVLTPNAVYIDG